MGLLYGENCMILTSTVFDLSTRVMDRQMDGRAIAYTALSICCCALETLDFDVVIKSWLRVARVDLMQSLTRVYLTFM